MIAFFRDPGNHSKSFKSFAAYKGEDVKEALDTMFGGKCAYCETFYASSAPVDVEHYRPKGEIELDDGRTIRPGYYWLAAEWTNLLPSCIDCNRERYQERDGRSTLSGKANRFPLLDEAQRATAPGEEECELPYLLDPCKDDPDEHLEFIEEGGIRAALDEGAEPSPRGERSIEILGLGRSGLVSDRRDHLTVVNRAVEHFRKAAQRLDESPDDPDLQAEVRSEISELQRLIEPGKRYTGMAKQKIFPVLAAAGVHHPAGDPQVAPP